MADVNSCVFTGRLTRDAELKATRNGGSVLSFGIAVNERRKDGDEWVDKPNFFNCSMFGSRAEALARYMVKGKQVAVAGRAQWREWERDGERRTAVDFVVNDLQLMGPRDDDGAERRPPAQQPARQDMLADDDIPF